MPAAQLTALAESFFATLQTEFTGRQVWLTRDSLRLAILDFVEIFYHRRRRHSSLDYLSPVDYERRTTSLPAV